MTSGGLNTATLLETFEAHSAIRIHSDQSISHDDFRKLLRGMGPCGGGSGILLCNNCCKNIYHYHRHVNQSLEPFFFVFCYISKLRCHDANISNCKRIAWTQYASLIAIGVRKYAFGGHVGWGFDEPWGGGGLYYEKVRA